MTVLASLMPALSTPPSPSLLASSRCLARATDTVLDRLGVLDAGLVQHRQPLLVGLVSKLLGERVHAVLDCLGVLDAGLVQHRQPLLVGLVALFGENLDLFGENLDAVLDCLGVLDAGLVQQRQPLLELLDTLENILRLQGFSSRFSTPQQTCTGGSSTPRGAHSRW